MKHRILLKTYVEILTVPAVMLSALDAVSDILPETTLSLSWLSSATGVVVPGVDGMVDPADEVWRCVGCCGV